MADRKAVAFANEDVRTEMTPNADYNGIGFSTDIGNILVRMGVCAWAEIHMAVEKQQDAVPAEKLGQILVDACIISPQILQEALELQVVLRGPKESPRFVAGLSKLFNHAVDSYQQSNLSVAAVLDGVKR